MKKQFTLMMLLAALLVPWAVRAQDCTQTVPFFEGFETTTAVTSYSTAGQVPTCWNAYSSGTSAGYVPHVVSGTSSYVYRRTGDKSLVMYPGTAATSGTNKYVVLPPMNVALNLLQLSFWMCTESATNGVLTVGYLTSNDTATFTPIQQYSASTATVHSGNGLQPNNGLEVELSLASVPSTATRLAIKWYYGGSYGCCIDDVALDYIPTCPRVSSLHANPGYNSANISWVEEGTATSWIVTVSNATGVVSSNLYTTNPAVVTGLNATTDYTAEVRAYCGVDDTSSSRSVAFRTQCEPVATSTLPWTYGVEDASASGAAATYNPCLGRHQIGTTSNYPYPSTSQKHTGTYAMYYYSTATPIKSWTNLPLFEAPINTLQLSFWIYKTSANYGQMYVGVMSDPSDLSTFDTIMFVQPSSVSTWEYVEVPLSSYTGTGAFITLLASSSVLNYVYIDDITVSLPPACPRPTNIVLDTANSTTNTAALTWVDGGGNADEYIVEYGSHGFTIGTGTSVSLTTPGITINNLTMGAIYDIYITAVCGSDTSTIATGNFSTVCGALTENDLPYAEDFEAFGTGAAYGINSCWRKGTNSTTAYPYPYSTAAINGTRGLYLYGYYPSSATSTRIYSWVALPPVDDNIDMNDLMTTFKVKRGSTASNLYTTILYVGIADSVTAFTSATVIESSVTWIDTIDFFNQAASSVHDVEVSFDGYYGNGKYVVFYAPVPPLYGTSTYCYNYVYLDDVVLKAIPTCFKPTDLVLDSVTTEEAYLSWTPDSRTTNPSSWDIEYGPQGFTPGTGTTETATDTTVELTGLSVNTAYDVYVTANCGGDVSEARMISFVTNSVPADLPYFTGFEADQDSGWVLYNVGQPNYWMVGADSTGSANHALFITNNGTDNAYTIASATSNSYAFRLMELVDSGDYAISFDWKAYGESTYDYIRAFLVPNLLPIVPGELNGISATATPAGWINVGNYDGAVKLNLSSTVQTNTAVVHIPATATGYYKLVFFWHNDLSAGTQPPAWIDNVDVHHITCPAPNQLAVDDLGAYEATISWNANGEETDWQIKVNNGAWVDVSTNPYTIAGLSMVTNYTVVVRAVCGDGDTSFASDPISFRTLRDCGPDNANILDTIGNGTSSTTTVAFYASTSYPRCITAAVYTAEELNAMGLQINNRINSIKLHTGSTGGTIRQAKIYMKEVDFSGYGATVANDTVDRSTMTLVKSGDLTFTASSWNEIMLDSAFAYSGNNDLMIAFAHDTVSAAAVTFYYTSTSPDYLNAYFYMTSTATTFSTGTRSYNRADIAFDICTEVPPCERPTMPSTLAYTDTEATLVWNGDAPAYQMMFSTTSVDPDSLGAATVTYYNYTTDTAAISGLTPATTYYWYVRSLCATGDTSDWSIEGSFTTACAPMALPYTENFESYGTGSANAISPCWKKGTNSTTAYPYPYATNAVNGQRSLYFYAYRPSSATAASYYSYAALPMMAAPIDTLAVSFSMRRYGTTTVSYTSRLVVGVMDNPDDIATFTPVDTIDLYNEDANSVHTFEVLFNSYTGNGKFIAFYDEVPPLYGTGTTSYSYVYLDDIVVDYIPSCARVTNVAVDSITTTSATIFWNVDSNVLSYEIEYGPVGFAHGTGTTITSNTGDSVEITGLMPSRPYDVYVRANCTTTDAGPWSFCTSFRTLCGIYSVPFYEDFELYGSGSTMGIDPCWRKGTSSTTAYPYPYSTNAVNGQRSLYFYAYHPSSTSTTAIYSYVALPEFNMSVDSLELSFNVRRYSTTTIYYTTYLIVGVMSNPEDITTFVGVDTIDLQTAPASSIHEITVDFSRYTDTGKYIAIYAPVPPLYGTGTYSYSYAYVDDIFVSQVSPCPRAYNLTAYNGNANSVTLGWADTIGSTSWVVEYGLLGDTATTIVTANSNPYLLTGLTPGTNYRYRVAPMCASGAQADWSREWHNFGTALAPAALPYSYNFEDAAEWANWQTSSNSPVNWYRGNVAQGNATNALYLSADSGATHSWNMNILTNAVAYRDIDFGTDTGSFQIEFDAYMGGTIDHGYDGISVVVTDPAYYVGVSNTAITSPWGNVNDVGYYTVRRDTNWGHYTVYLDGMAGVKRLAFYHFNQATGASNAYMNNPSAVDNVNVMAQPCVRPYDLAATNATIHSIDLAWEGDAAATYQIAYRVQGAAASTTAYAIATGNSYTLMGLGSSTNYYWWVRKICTLTATDTLVSSFSATGAFSTLCSAVSVADTLFENFESYNAAAYNAAGVLPNCWEGYTTGPTGYTPHVTDSGTYSYCVSGRKAITMTAGTSTSYGSDAYLRLIDIAEPTNTLTVAFWMCTESSSNGFLEVGYLTGNDYATDFVALKRINASSATYHSGNGIQAAGHGIFDTVSFDSVPAGNYPICFRWNYTTSFYSVCLDDIAVWTNFSCVAPAVTLTALDYQSATLNVVGSGESFTLAYGSDQSNMSDTLTNTTGVFNLSGLLPATTYYYAARQQCDSVSISLWSEGRFTTDSLPCFVPTNVAVQTTTYNSAILGWDANTSPAYELHIVGASLDRYDTAYTNPYNVTGLYQGTEYTVTVRSLCMIGVEESDYSAPYTFTTNACNMPEGVTVSNVTYQSAEVSWQAVSGAQGYNVYWGEPQFYFNLVTPVPVTGTSYTITGLEAESPYEVVVVTRCTESIEASPTNSDRIGFTTGQTGIYDVESGTLTLYPNPATTSVSVNVTGMSGNVTLQIVDMNGRTVYSQSGSNEFRIDVSSLAQGAYFVRVTSEQQTAVRKLIVK